MTHYVDDAGYDFAVRSDFLVHWTGKDFDKEWDNGVYSRTGKKILVDDYLKRLQDILGSRLG